MFIGKEINYEMFTEHELNISKVKTVKDCAKLLKFYEQFFMNPLPAGVEYNGFDEVEKYYMPDAIEDESIESETTKLTFRVIQDGTGKDITNEYDWMLTPEGRLVINEYGDLIGVDWAKAVFNIEE